MEEAEKIIDEELVRIIESCAAKGTAPQITRCIADLLNASGFIILDRNDIMEILSGADTIAFGEGTGEGPGRGEQAAKNALSSPSMPASLKGFDRFLINFATGPDITLMEMVRGAEIVHEAADPGTKITWGHVIEEGLGGRVRVSLIAAKTDGK